MARDFFINGESMVAVKGNVNTSFSSLTNFGLSLGPIRVSLDFRFREINIDAFGGEIPVDVQYMLSGATVHMDLINIDRDLLDAVLRESMGGVSTIGQVGRAGTRLGGGNARFAAGWHYVGLNILSPIGNKPWRFYAAYLMGTPLEITLGTEKSSHSMAFRCIPYATDPWGGGTGAANVPLWDYTLDS